MSVKITKQMVLKHLPKLPIDIFNLFELDYIDSCMLDVGIVGDYKYLKNLLKNFEVKGFYNKPTHTDEVKTTVDGVDIYTIGNCEYHYKDGNIVKELVLNIDDEGTDSIIYYGYDDGGQKIFESDRYEHIDGSVKTYSYYYEYNSNNNVVKNISCGIMNEFQYKYDFMGNIVELITDSLITKYKYNENSDVVEIVEVSRNIDQNQKSTKITQIDYSDTKISITIDGVGVCTIEKNKLQLGV